jgi:hypothetical protein
MTTPQMNADDYARTTDIDIKFVLSAPRTSCRGALSAAQRTPIGFARPLNLRSQHAAFAWARGAKTSHPP